MLCILFPLQAKINATAQNRVMRHKHASPLISLLLATSTLVTPVYANKPLFEDDKPIKAVLSAPLSQLYKQRKKEVRLYQDATLSFQGEHGTQKANLKVRTRGNWRRLNCKHPPLRLNFKKKANDGGLFERQDKLKLVGQCKNGSKYEEFVGLEYLVYKIWEELSPHHLKSRRIEMSYVDTDERMKPRTVNTFVIESIEDAAKRSNKKLLDIEKIKRRQLDRQATALAEIFQLFIGNTDYSTITGQPGSTCCHNIRLIADKTDSPETSTGVIPIPYDFDVSGFVDAPYAAPAAQYPIEDVRRRYFSGTCKEERHFTSAITRFNDRKTAIYDIVNNAEFLSTFSLKKTRNYLDAFYTLIDNPERVQKEILERCRGSLIKG
ncbi:MAG: hypothetical protein ACI8XV_002139 [Arenicella sp.]|jgi:hypothetical protein